MFDVTPEQLRESYDALWRSEGDELKERIDSDWRLRRRAKEYVFAIDGREHAAIIVYARMWGYSATVVHKHGGDIRCEEFNYYKKLENLKRAILRKHSVDFDSPVACSWQLLGKSAAIDYLDEREAARGEK